MVTSLPFWNSHFAWKSNRFYLKAFDFQFSGKAMSSFIGFSSATVHRNNGKGVSGERWTMAALLAVMIDVYSRKPFFNRPGSVIAAITYHIQASRSGRSFSRCSPRQDPPRHQVGRNTNCSNCQGPLSVAEIAVHFSIAWLWSLISPIK